MTELSADTQRSILAWLKEHEHSPEHRFTDGYQAHTLLYDQDGCRLVVKTAFGSGPLGYIRRLTLRHESSVYQRLNAVPAVPKYYGLLEGRYLILGYIPAQSLRQAKPPDHEFFCGKLFDAIKALHAQNVAHMDLKKKGNILVTAESEPILVDFGAAVIYKPGFHPLNHFLYGLAKQFDLNAWLKHKYHRRYQKVSEEDRQYLHRTWLERAAKFIKVPYRRCRSKLRNLRA